MAKSRWWAAGVALTLLAAVVGGCDREGDDPRGDGPSSATTTTTSTSAADDDVVLTSVGLTITIGESTREVRFDASSLADAKAAVSAELGPPVKEADQQCDSGADHQVVWTGLTIYSTDGTFTGWYANTSRVANPARIGVGSSKADLDQAYGPGNVETFETTLGTEWSAGGYSGIFEGGANTKIAGMWAGTNCVFR